MVASTIEQVWGIPRTSMLEQVGEFQGFRADDGDLAARCRDLEPHGSFRPRDQVEDDPHWKQVIPYLAVTCGGKLLVLRRLASQGESRLHHRLSIGVGGHINPESPGPRPLIVRGLLREVSEELELDSSDIPEPVVVGWINDDSTAVGRVHLGLACRIEVSEEVGVRERDRMEGTWQEIVSLSPEESAWESWSSLLIPAIAVGIESCTD